MCMGSTSGMLIIMTAFLKRSLKDTNKSVDHMASKTAPVDTDT